MEYDIVGSMDKYLWAIQDTVAHVMQELLRDTFKPYKDLEKSIPPEIDLNEIIVEVFNSTSIAENEDGKEIVVWNRDAVEGKINRLKGIIGQGFDPAVDGCYVKLNSHGNQKINAIKIIREATNWGLKESKDIVEKAPTIIKGISASQAKQIAEGINSLDGASAYFCEGECAKCIHRFRCWTER